MTGKVNLAAKLASFSEHFSPRIVADLNNYKIEVVKAKGEFVWHTHTPRHRRPARGEPRALVEHDADFF